MGVIPEDEIMPLSYAKKKVEEKPPRRRPASFMEELLEVLAELPPRSQPRDGGSQEVLEANPEPGEASERSPISPPPRKVLKANPELNEASDIGAVLKKGRELWEIMDSNPDTPFFRTGYQGEPRESAWAKITRSMPDRVGYGLAFVNEAIALEISSYLQRGSRKVVLDIGGGGHSYVDSDVIDLCETVMRGNPRAKRMYVHNFSVDPEIDNVVERHDYSLVTMMNTMAYVQKPRELFAAVLSCLGPGGRFVIGFDNREEPPLSTIMWQQFKHSMLSRKGIVAACLEEQGYVNIGVDDLEIPFGGQYAVLNQVPFAMVYGEKAK